MTDLLAGRTTRLADHTTLRVGGPARAWVEATSEAELVAAVQAADAAGEPLLSEVARQGLTVAGTRAWLNSQLRRRP